MACVWSWLRMILERLVEGAKISWNDNVSSTSKLDMATDIGNSKGDLIIRRSAGFNVSSPKSILSLTATNPFGVCIFIHIHLHIHIYNNTIIYFHFRNMYTHTYVYIYIYHHHIHIYYVNKWILVLDISDWWYLSAGTAESNEALRASRGYFPLSGRLSHNGRSSWSAMSIWDLHLAPCSLWHYKCKFKMKLQYDSPLRQLHF